jgi:nicotinate-nucleotide pyrophosphorylase (carboxylating)
MEGPLRGILLLERTLLNLLGRLCGVATLTGAFVARVRGTRARIRDTRKTTPGLRALEKHAVRCGGATPHRFGLFDAFLAKDNHVAGMAPSRMAREIRRGVESARRRHALRFAMVEADSLAQVEALLRLPAGVVDAILLDNMPLASLRRAVARRDLLAPRVRLEASGGVTLRSVAAIARTGVDFISVGAITHSAPQVDLSLEVRADAAAARRR